MVYTVVYIDPILSNEKDTISYDSDTECMVSDVLFDYHVEHRSEVFTSLQLDMNPTLSSLDEHVQAHFLNAEGLSDYKCRNGRCNLKGTCNKQLVFFRWPRVLMVY